MKGLAILAGFLATFLLADSAFAAGHPPRPGRHGPVLVGYIYTGGSWRLHVDLAQSHQLSAPGLGSPTRPPRTIQAVTLGGVYGPIGFCRHGIVYLTEQPPNFPGGGVFPIPQPPIFPRPMPPLPPLPPPPIIIFTNTIPVRPIRTEPVSPPPPTDAQALLLEANRLRQGQNRAGRPPVPPPLPPSSLTTQPAP
jgi:hypothetical protein